MRALTVQQPWASALLWGGKDVENRSWSTPHRGEVAIHAGLAIDEPAFKEVLALTGDPDLLALAGDPVARGAVLGTVVLEDCHIAGAGYGRYRCTPAKPCSPWAQPGQWHWVVSRPVGFEIQIPARGALGLWTVPDDVEYLVRMHVFALERGCESCGEMAVTASCPFEAHCADCCGCEDEISSPRPVEDVDVRQGLL